MTNPNKLAYLYKIVNSVNGKTYIGKTIKPKLREWDHMTCSQSCSKLVKSAINKYGRANLTFSVIAKGPEDYILDLEYKAIASYQSLVPHGYNISTGGQNGGKPHTEQSKRKISEANRGDKNPMWGKFGELNHFYGRHHTEETKAKLRAASVVQHRRPWTEEERKAISDRQMGSDNPSAKDLILNGKLYGSHGDVANELGHTRLQFKDIMKSLRKGRKNRKGYTLHIENGVEYLITPNESN